MKRWIGNAIVRKRESIVSSCRDQLTPTHLDEAQRPYVPIGDDNLGFGCRMVGAATVGFSYTMHDSGLDIVQNRFSHWRGSLWYRQN